MGRVLSLPNLIFVLAVLLTSIRAFYGIDFSDEAQYVSQALSPIVANGFFESDFFIQQIVYIFYYPLVQVYVFLFETEGVFLFLRMLFLVESFFASFLLYRFTEKKFGHDLSILLASAVVAYVPFSIYSLSYNNVIAHFFSVIVAFLLFHEEKAKWESVVVGFLSVFMCFSYPPSVLFFGAFVFINYVVLRGEFGLSQRDILFWKSFAVGSLAFLCFLTMMYKSGLVTAFEFSSSFATITPKEKLFLIGYQLRKFVAASFLFLIFFKFFPLFVVKNLRLVLLVFLVFGIYNLREQAIYSNILVSALSFSGFFWLVLLKKKIEKSLSLYLFFHLFMSFVCSYSSSNGLINAGLALIVPSFIFLFVFLRQGRSLIACASVFVIAVLACNYNYFYREDGFSKLTERVSKGPYSGLITSKNKKEILDQLGLAVNAIKERASSESLVTAVNFPAFYPLNLFRTSTRMFYIHDAYFNEYQKEFLSSGVKVDFLVIHRLSDENKRNEIVSFLCKDCDLVFSSSHFEVLHRKLGDLSSFY
jgi:hypothetical protein